MEDTRTRTTAKARVGETICDGRLVAITLDYVDYERGGSTIRIEVGSNLEGAAPGPTAEPPAAAVADPAAGSATDNSEEAILQRLRQKRQKELGK